MSNKNDCLTKKKIPQLRNIIAYWLRNESFNAIPSFGGSSKGLFYNQGTSSKKYIAALFKLSKLTLISKCFCQNIDQGSTYSNKEKVRINQLIKFKKKYAHS